MISRSARMKRALRDRHERKKTWSMDSETDKLCLEGLLIRLSKVGIEG